MFILFVSAFSLISILLLMVNWRVFVGLVSIACDVGLLILLLRILCFNLRILAAFTFFACLFRLRAGVCLYLKMLNFLCRVSSFNENFPNIGNFEKILFFLNTSVYYHPHPFQPD
jgi:hypothetical protein